MSETPTPPLPPATPPTALPQNETDERFPSGPWTGFFLQPALPGRHWMELHLSFLEGKIRGEGRDWVGSFVVTGRYETETGKCWLSKKYLGKHDVAYMGYNEGRGIWGTWEMIDPPWKGGFHIWPEGMRMGDSVKAAEESEPVSGVIVSSWTEESLSEDLVSVGVGGGDSYEDEDQPSSSPEPH